MVQPLGNWQFCMKLNLYLPDAPAIALPSISSRQMKTYFHTNVSTRMLTGGLFMTENGNNPKTVNKREATSVFHPQWVTAQLLTHAAAWGPQNTLLRERSDSVPVRLKSRPKSCSVPGEQAVSSWGEGGETVSKWPRVQGVAVTRCVHL